MRLKITARELLITRIQERNGWIRIEFSAETKVEPQDVLSLVKRKDGKIRLLPEGFEMNLSGRAWQDVYEKVTEIMHSLLIRSSAQQ
jgi:transcription-repair coupling factor (superfamily II helicase)